MTHPQDRAAVVTTAIMSIIVESLRSWLHGEPVTLSDVRRMILDYLRDEFDDCVRQAREEYALPDDG